MQNVSVLIQSDTHGHHTGKSHPECAGRLDVVKQALTGITPPVQWVEATRVATDHEITLVHQQEFLDRTKRQVEDLVDTARVVTHWSDLESRDTKVAANSLAVARCASGAVLQALSRVQRGVPSCTFVAVRPPGHHACADETAGFCLLNNVAIAAHAAQQLGYKEILIVDFDVHHGDGTENIVAKDDGVVYFSTHRVRANRREEIYFPGTGDNSRHRNIVNIPITRSAVSRSLVVKAYTQRLAQELGRMNFRPDLVLISAGFDAVASEDDGGLGLVPRDFYEITQAIIAVAGRSPIISVLEGGYDLRPGGLGACCAEHVQALQARMRPAAVAPQAQAPVATPPRLVRRSVKERTQKTDGELAQAKKEEVSAKRKAKLGRARAPVNRTIIF